MDKFMRLAFSLAKLAEPFPNPKVGAVIVKNGKILGSGYHRKPGKPHAEIEAMKNARKRFGRNSLSGSVLYVTQEPCSHTLKRTPPCTKAIIENKISKVIFATKDPNMLVNSRNALRKQGIKVVGPTDQKQLERINHRYVARLKAKPFVEIKMAMSADGKTATRTGDAKWISGPKSLLEVHKMRSKFDAIMVGAGTVINDNPRLTARRTNFTKFGLFGNYTVSNTIKNGRNPYRIIVDGKLNIPLNSKVLYYSDNKTIIFTSENAKKNKIMQIERRSKNNAHIVICGKKEVDMKEMMRILSAMGIMSVMIEGGSELNANAMEANIVDRITLFIAPKIIGGKGAKPVIGGLGIAKMKDAIMLKNMKYEKIGSDLMVQFDFDQKR